MFEIGRPIGTRWPNSLPVTSWQVASALTSDDPYKFISTLLGMADANCSANSGGSVSPLQIQYLSLGNLLFKSIPDSNIERSSDGTRTMRVTPFSDSAGIRRDRSFTS